MHRLVGCMLIALLMAMPMYRAIHHAQPARLLAATVLFAMALLALVPESARTVLHASNPSLSPESNGEPSQSNLTPPCPLCP